MTRDNVTYLRPVRAHRSDASAYEEAVQAQRDSLKDDPEAPRFVRPASPLSLAQATRDENAQLYYSFEEEERIARAAADARRDSRALFWRSMLKRPAIVLAYALIAYFSFQVGRGL